MNKGEGKESILWSKSEMNTCKVRTLVRYYKICLTRAAGSNKVDGFGNELK